MSETLRDTFDDRTILDGELYKHEWNWDAQGNKVNCLQRINGAVTPIRQQPNADTIQVEYHIFDRPMRGVGFYDRMEVVRQKDALLQDTKIRRVHTHKVGSEDAANLCYSQFVAQGYEGMMYRLGDCPYTMPKDNNTYGLKVPNHRAKLLSDKDNRCWHLLKRKDWQDAEFECVAIEEGEGKYKGMVGALTCTLKYKGFLVEARTFTVSGGLTDTQRDKFFDHPELIIGKQIKVKYLCLSQDQIPLNPTILCIL